MNGFLIVCSLLKPSRGKGETWLLVELTASERKEH